MKKSSKAKPKARFICFSSTGKIGVRTCTEVVCSKPPRVKIQGAPEPTRENGKADNYVNAPPETVVFELLLKDTETEYDSSGYYKLDEIVPVNAPAVRLVTELKWRRLNSEFKNRCKNEGVRKPTLKEIQRKIKRLVLK